MARPSQQVLRKVLSHREELRRYGVRRIGLFGSAMRGTAGKESDLDFIVELERETFNDYMGLKVFLEDLFQKKVDLVLPHTIKPALRDSILSTVRYADLTKEER